MHLNIHWDKYNHIIVEVILFFQPKIWHNKDKTLEKLYCSDYMRVCISADDSGIGEGEKETIMIRNYK